jgi:transposase InsO family protein
MLSHEIPTRPWQAIGVDIFTDGNIDYLVTVCCLSGCFEVDRLPSKKVGDVVYILRQQMARHGIPEVLYSDNNPFGAVEFQRFAAKWEFRHVTSSLRYPQSNSFAEAAVKSARRLIKKSREAGTDPPLALLAQRNTPSEHRQLSPAQIMFGRRTRTTLPTAETLLMNPAVRLLIAH